MVAVKTCSADDFMFNRSMCKSHFKHSTYAAQASMHSLQAECIQRILHDINLLAAIVNYISEHSYIVMHNTVTEHIIIDC